MIAECALRFGMTASSDAVAAGFHSHLDHVFPVNVSAGFAGGTHPVAGPPVPSS